MARTKFLTDGSDGSHERPWVYFMVDSFFLVTQFFVLTFHLRVADDLVLPNKLTPGASLPDRNVTVIPVGIVVLRNPAEAEAKYLINGGAVLNEREMVARLGSMVEGQRPERYSVRVSYDGKTVFKDVMVLFDTCKKLRIKECGLQPSRSPNRV